MVFDEEKSWYFDKRSRSPCTEKTQERQQCHKFYGTYLILPSIQFVVVEGKVLGEVSQLTEFLNTHKSYTLIMWMGLVLLLFSIIPIIVIVSYVKISIDSKFVITMKKGHIRQKLSTENYSLVHTYVYTPYLKRKKENQNPLFLGRS